MDKLQVPNTALLIIDMQENLISSVDKPQAVINGTSLLIESLALFKVPVIITEQFRRFLGPTVKEITKQLPSTKPLAKMSFNCCREPEFMAALKNIDRKQLILVGVETHICVLQTASALQKAGYQVYLASDACTSRAPFDHEIGLDLMRRAGVVISSTETIIFQLLQTAKSDEYKKIIKIIKSQKKETS